MKLEFSPLGALILALGLVASAWLVRDGMVQNRIAGRYVTVKGVAERHVQADIALWPIRYVATHDVLAQAQQRSAGDEQTTRAFLERHGIAKDQVEVRDFEVTDLLADRYRGENIQSRYIVNATLLVRSADVQRVRAASQAASELAAAGVVLAGGENGGRPTYLFTRLNDIKPAMIAEATANARRAAEQFAADSQSGIGNIKSANQGQFVILPRTQTQNAQEEAEPDKTVRVVSTVEYFLRD